MRGWVVGVLVVLVVGIPAAGVGIAPLTCPNEHDASKLPSPAVVLGAARAVGLDLSLAKPLPMQGGDALPNYTACTGKIRPGAPLIIQGAFLCTANWVLQDQDYNFYIGTAGHCIPDLSWNRIAIRGLSDDIGDPVFTTGNGGPGNDYALIKVDPQYRYKVDPTLCHWGGPQGVAHQGDQSNLAGEMALLQYGWGFVYGETPLTRPRAGFLDQNFWDASDVIAVMPVAGGDSGSGIETSYGAAVGIVTHTLEVPPVNGIGAPLGLGYTIATRLDWAIATASNATGLQLRLVNSTHPVDLTGLSIP